MKPLPNPNAELIVGLAGQIHVQLADLLPRKSYALVDFPDHSNVGDSAIWLGELAYFRQHLGYEPAYTCSHQRYAPDVLERYCPEGPIFIHGGGNFGDIWPHHHNFRLEILRSFPARRIVQLPQSIHFSDEARLEETARAIAAHGNFLLLVRDKPSLELARQRFDCEVRLSPDMAFCIGVVDRPAPPVLDILYLLRTDAERRDGVLPALREGEDVADWIEDELLPLRIAKACGLARGMITGPGSHRSRNAFYEDAAWSRVRRGLRLLSKGSAVVTDRLHSHILSLLLGIPHAVLDNNYGKLSRFINAWTGGASDLSVARSLAEARAWAVGLGDAGLERGTERGLHAVEAGR